MSLSPKLKAKTIRRYPSDWSETDTRAVDTVRLLAADAVQNCGSGHPGTAMSLAPLAYTLSPRTRIRQGAAASCVQFDPLLSRNTSSSFSAASALSSKT